MNTPYRPRRPAELLLGTLFLDLGGDHRDTILVAGSGRSGTTWLSDLINRENKYRLIFEPFLRKQYLRPEDENPEHLDAAGKILSGKTRSRWADRFNRKPIARKRLIKDIRANLLLGWLRRHFPEMPMIFLLRHPCAVADSRLRLGWRDNLDEVMSQKQLVEDHLKPLEAGILAVEDPFERSIFLWCIENYVPLRQPGSDKLHIVFYEELASNPEGELASISGFLGEKKDGWFSPSPGADRRGASRKPRPLRRDAPPEGGSRAPGSEREMPDSSPGSEARRISGWTERVGEGRRRRAAEIMELFGMDRIYGEGSMPSPEGIFEVPKP